MTLSASELEAQFQTAKRHVEALVTKVGLDPSAVRGKEDEGLCTWTLKRGSAAVLVSISKSDRGEGAYLRVVSPVMTLPAVERQPELFRRLLELNAGGIVNAAFGIIHERIVVVSERPAAGLDGAEVEQIVKHLSAVADTFDDRLVREFGGQRAADA